MPPKKLTKVETKEIKVDTKKVETNEIKVDTKKDIKKDIKKVDIKKEDIKKEVKTEKVEKGKKFDVKENKKWAEVTDDEYHDEDDGQVEVNSSEKSDDSSSDSDEDGVIDEEALLETLKTVNSGTKPGQNGKSICDFDYEEIQLLDAEELSDYDTNTLIKVLMVRGTNNNNPILWSKSKTLLRLLNFEITPNQPFHGNQNRGGFRGGRGGFRGGRGGFRGGYNGDRNDRNDNYKPRNENFEGNVHEEEHVETEKKDDGNWRGNKNWRGGKK
jgi:hypothetical protein